MFKLVCIKCLAFLCDYEMADGTIQLKCRNCGQRNVLIRKSQMPDPKNATQRPEVDLRNEIHRGGAAAVDNPHV